MVNKGSAPEYDVEKKVISLPSCVKRVTYSYLSLGGIQQPLVGKGPFIQWRQWDSKCLCMTIISSL